MKKTKCSYADKYKAVRKPTCGCSVCYEKYINKIEEENVTMNRNVKMLARKLSNIENSISYRLLVALKEEILNDVDSMFDD